MIWIAALLGLPLLTGFLSWPIKTTKTYEKVQAVCAFCTLLVGLGIAVQVLSGKIVGIAWWIFNIDALGAFNVLLIVCVGFTATLYSVGYIQHELTEDVISQVQFRQYYFCFHTFIFTMLAVSCVNNLGLLWVGIELTTLVSALLVAFYKKGTALEAAWKYLIMSSVGIAFALLGIIFLYLSGIQSIGENPQALNWSVLTQVSSHLNPRWILVAFIFVLVGFGTKAGLAPMHFWLPDAHSQAPSPVSAVLSGVLLNTAMYGILRVYTVANLTLGGKAAQYLVAFGLISILISIPFILVQHDLKRMLAYSSVEHMGIITLGTGIGGMLGLYGALLHMFNHSMTKSMLFFAAGNINQKYHSKHINRITGIIKTMPVTSFIFLIASFAITGTPPFSMFISEFTIMMAGFKTGHILVTILFMVAIVLIFAGMIFYVVKMVFGDPPAKLERKEVNRWSTTALFIPLVLVVFCGFYVPDFFSEAIQRVTHVLQGA